MVRNILIWNRIGDVSDYVLELLLGDTVHDGGCSLVAAACVVRGVVATCMWACGTVWRCGGREAARSKAETEYLVAGRLWCHTVTPYCSSRIFFLVPSWVEHQFQPRPSEEVRGETDYILLCLN